MNSPKKTNNSLHDRTVVIDCHVHPALKTYLFNKKLYRKYRTGGAWNPFTLRVDLPKIQLGGVNALFSSIYLPEIKMIEDCWFLRLLTSLPCSKFRDLVKKDPFQTTLKMLDHFENAVSMAAAKGIKVEIATSVSSLRRILSENRIALIHSIEGAHSLSGSVEHIKILFERGVSLLTLAHFYENEATFTVGGIPEDKKFLCCFRNEKEQNKGLTKIGREMVQEMIDLGMLVDLTHCTKAARREIFSINNNNRPLLFSHTGVYALNPKQMNPSDEEIKMTADSGGVIGVIFMNYWLQSPDRKEGLNLIIDTIKHLKNIGGIDCIAIGSDFDGFTDPPDDIKDISEMPKLTHRLLNCGFSENEVEKIIGKNLMRVIEEGWGKRE
jgi:membrane dipeptidase